MSAWPAAADDAGATFVVHKERFEVEQYVRVHLGNNRTEIGVVADIDEDKDQITITTQQGYDVTVRTSAVRRAFLLVLDLNGVLVARGRGTFIHRPHVRDFVKYVFNNFVVAVWTSGLERSSNPVIDSVLEGYQERLLFVRYRDSCEPRPTEENPYGTIKNLQRIFDAYPKSFHSANTIIIDDSPDKCSHPDIALCPIPFKDPVLQCNDIGLAKAMEVLDEVLTLDSHTPLIRAAAERRSEMHEQALHAHDTPAGATDRKEMEVVPLAQVNLWKTRLCCDNMRGCCKLGDRCGYSHDPDDGKHPCSYKNNCRYGHASRWVVIDTENTSSAKSRRRQRQQEHHHQQQQKERPSLTVPQGQPKQQQQQPVPSWQENKNMSWTEEEERTVMHSQKSHTGIPHLDREIEAAAAAERQRLGDASAPTHLTPFSTRPQAYHEGTLSQRPASQYRTNAPSLSERLQRERDRIKEEDRQAHRSHYSGNKKTANAGNERGQLPERKVPSRQQGHSDFSGNSQASDAPSSIHLTNSGADGTALLRQLQRMTQNS